jgi:excisionase family DNA binding protein
VGEGRTEGAQQGKEYVTVGEAAKLLGVHRNTIHHRIKSGRISAHKVLEGDREIYRIERDSLDVGRTSADVRTFDAQRTTAGEALSRMIATRLDKIVRDYTHPLGDFEKSSAQSGHGASWRSPRCEKGWPRSGGAAKRPNGSATTYGENFTLAESRENRPGRLT